MGSAHNPTAVSECQIKRLAETNTDVFGSVVIVDMQVTIGIDGYVKLTVFSKQRKHMVEEADAGMGVTKPGTIDI